MKNETKWIDQYFSHLAPSQKFNIVVSRILYVFYFYILIRIIFFVNNQDLLTEIPVSDLIKVSFVGLGTDVITIIVVNWIPFLFTFLVFKGSNYKIIDSFLFTLCNLPLILIALVEVEYFRYTGARITLSVLNIGTDILQQALNLTFYYWYISLILLIISVVFITYKPTEGTDKGYWSYFIIILLFFIYSSGILLSKTSDLSRSATLRYITSNSSLSLMRTGRVHTVKKLSILKDLEVTKLISRDTSGHNFIHSEKQNVIILICESLSTECLFNGRTDFLDSLSYNGVYFKNFFANGKESIDAVPAILSSVPKLGENHFIGYKNSSKTFPKSIASILNPLGYKTLFFHGARNGSMGFKSFTEQSGYNEYYGMDNYPNKEKHFDGAWGIYDEHFLSYACKILSKKNAPFHSVFFTLSSHNPYKLPKHFLIKKGEKIEMHTSIRYLDYSLKRFFAEAKTTNWYKNSIFIITGDHTHLQAKTGTDSYRVPLIIFHPNKQELDQIRSKSFPSKISQQTDIMPTILDFLNVKEPELLPFGESIFAKNNGFAFFFDNDVYNWTSSKGDVSFSLYSKSADKMSLQSKNNLLKLQAIIQYYHNTLMQ